MPGSTCKLMVLLLALTIPNQLDANLIHFPQSELKHIKRLDVLLIAQILIGKIIIEMTKNMVIESFLNKKTKILNLASWAAGLTGSTGQEVVDAIKAEIQTNGTVVGTMYVYSDFYHYSQGVYKVN